jgi:hypothetical protein
MGDGTLATSAAARTILALDLGKFKSVACVLEAEAEAERGSGGGPRFETIATSPSAVAELLAEVRPDRLVIEACSIAGWVCDLARPLGIAVVVANANSAAWQWKRVKRKTDRDDAGSWPAAAGAGAGGVGALSVKGTVPPHEPTGSAGSCVGTGVPCNLARWCRTSNLFKPPRVHHCRVEGGGEHRGCWRPGRRRRSRCRC